MIGALVLAAVTVATYNCEVAAPQAVDIEGEKATVSAMGLPPEMQQRKFTVIISEGTPPRAEVKWPGNPMQVAGKFPVISTGSGAFAFSSYAFGGCLFSETACMSQVNLVDSNETSAKVIILPAGLISDSDKGARYPFIVAIQGNCSRLGAKK